MKKEREENIHPKDDKGRAHGFTQHYWGPNRLGYRGNYEHGKQVGLWYEDGFFSRPSGKRRVIYVE